MKEWQYWYWISNIKEIWNAKIRSLLSVFSHPAEVYWCSEKDLSSVPLITKEDCHHILEARRMNLQKAEDELERKHIHFVYPGHPDYPDKFQNMTDKPYSLYILGALPPKESKNIAIVGARACTMYGKSISERIAGQLAACDVGVISGLARGIDTAGQTGAIKAGGRTYAILGSGLNEIYPLENIELAMQILQGGGGIISEYPLDAKPLKWQFPMRNRLISALSDGVVVTEAKERSGSLITVNFALEQGKDVYALPGRITDPLSRGCNRLIQKGAVPLTDVSDILNELKITPKPPRQKEEKKETALAKEMEVVYSHISLFPKSVHTIIEETGLPASVVTGILIKLLLMDLIEEPAKNLYVRKG